MQKVRLGYVGAGFVAQAVHLPNFTTLPDCEVVALAEIRPQLAQRVAERFGIPRVYRTHHELLLDPDIDAVAVSAHFVHQAQVAEDALRAGKPVFMEKPMALTVARAERLLQAEREGGGRLMVAYMKRYDAGIELAKNLIDGYRQSGELGRLFYLRARCFTGNWTGGNSGTVIQTDEPYPPVTEEAPDWLPERYRQSYVGYLQVFCHNVNLARWLLGAGADWQVISVDLDEDGFTGVAVLRLGGVRVTLETGALSAHQWDEDTQAYFQRGWVKATSPSLLLRNACAEVEEYRAGEGAEYRRRFPKDGWSWSFQREAQHFIQCVRTGEPFRSSGEDAAEDVRLIEAIYQRWLRKSPESATAV
ncbi:MAG: Gfo/Idh/MocA family oxidoreductase [Armatimonadota bacterium]|nr:Gfo/Idh/MocA family oxidoreductase [Armatimonadota bacterium]